MTRRKKQTPVVNVSAEAPVPRRRCYVPVTALAKSVEFDEEVMRVTFTDGRVPELDEDLSIAGLMAGVDWRAG
jgi:hypothetical protein